MMTSLLLAHLSSLLLLGIPSVTSQGGAQTCTGITRRFPGPSQGRCLPWAEQRLQQKTYPDDFGDILNQVAIYQCPSSKKRVVISNGIPNHDVILQNRNAPCESNFALELPLHPQQAAEHAEVPIRGMIAMTLSGVPAYGPQEADSLNALEDDNGVPGARFWYGHSGANLVWHVHNPQMCIEQQVSPDTLLGYALDGFPIYGP